MHRQIFTTQFTTVAVLAAAVVIGLLSWLSQQIPANSISGVPGLLVQIFLATGSYFLIFRLFLLLYYKFFWRFVNANIYLNGDWQYLFNESYDPDLKTYTLPDGEGVARIEHSPADIVIYGETTHPSENTHFGLSTTWKSTSSSLVGLSLSLGLLFSQPTGTANGFATLTIVTKSSQWFLLPRFPTEIHGHYMIGPTSHIPMAMGRVSFRRCNKPISA